MLKSLYILLAINLQPFSVYGFCGNSNRRISDPISCKRYRECSNGEWKIVDCPPNTYFNGTVCNVDEPCNLGIGWVSSNAIDNGPANRKIDEHFIEEDNGFNTTTVRRRRMTTLKSYRSYTKTDNGRKVTTLWYYNSNGPNYKFSIYGDPPAPRDEMIEWLEKNSGQYKLTPVPYKGDSDEAPLEPSTKPTTPRPPPTRPPSTKPMVTYITRPTPKPAEKPPAGTTADNYLPAYCGLTGSDLDKVVGGHESRIEDTPWQAALVRANNKQLSCGGSIITFRHVVTAAHCFRSKNRGGTVKYVKKEDRLVVAGGTILNGDAIEYSIQKLILHGKYTEETKRNDIALILIDGQFNFDTSKIYPICMPIHQEVFNPGRQCKISGWGKVAASVKYTESHLRAADVKITTNEECKKENGRSLPISTGMVCAGNFKDGGVDTCQGDSGGPLACQDGPSRRFRLFGVTSWGIGCGDKRFPGVYTKVTEYVRWIRNRIEVTMGVRDRSTLSDADDYEDVDVVKSNNSDEEYDEKDIE